MATLANPVVASSLILVVDPDPQARTEYATGLARSGWDVDGVADSREALAKAIRTRPVVVITELRVPRLSGIELCRLLRGDPDTRGIALLVMTGDAEEKEIAAAKAAGADGVLMKPCPPEELTRTVNALIKASHGRQPAPPSVEDPPRGPGERRVPSSRQLRRGKTMAPPRRPPDLVCPKCDARLTYGHSHIGGVSARQSEQWDDFECPAGCGRFQYRHRTRAIRAIE